MAAAHTQRTEEGSEADECEVVPYGNAYNWHADLLDDTSASATAVEEHGVYQNRGSGHDEAGCGAGDDVYAEKGGEFAGEETMI